MCIKMFKLSSINVYIYSLVHIFYIQHVAKKVTLTTYIPINNTSLPQLHQSRARAVNTYPVKSDSGTLSTSTTTTIFKIVIRKITEQKNSSLTIHQSTIYN